MVNGLGSGRDAALAFVPVAVAAVPEQPATRTARPAAAAATARRAVVPCMVPPVCRRSPWTVRGRKAGGIGAATRAGLWPARIFPAAAVPQSGHGTRGAVRGHSGTPGRAGPPGRSVPRRGLWPAPVRVAAPLAGLAVATGALAVAAGPGRATTYAGSSAAGTAL